MHFMIIANTYMYVTCVSSHVCVFTEG